MAKSARSDKLDAENALAVQFKNQKPGGMNMKRKFFLSCIVIAVIVILVAPAHAIFCHNCGVKNADEAIYCIKCGEKLKLLEGKNIYDQSCELFRQEKYDEVISSLVGYCASNPQDIKSQILLAKAYLEKCDLLKEQGSQQYKTLVYKPFEMGKKIIRPRDQYLSEGLYICGRSFHINRRANRASKYLKKAIKLSMSPPAEYFIALGDAQFTEGINEDPTGFESSYYLSAKNTYKRVVDMEIENNEKGKAYYKLGVLHLYVNEKKDAKQAFESALKFAENDSLISKIHSKMESK
jgi:tetratricopeptide (TPR) repeat protein